MIHSLKTACCDHCAQTGGSCGGHGHSHGKQSMAGPRRMGWSAFRRMAGLGRLGQTLQCDQDGNCYEIDSAGNVTNVTGNLSLAAVQASAATGTCAYGTDAYGNCLPGTTTLTPSTTSAFSAASSWLTSNSTMLVALAALVGIAATLTSSGGRRR